MKAESPRGISPITGRTEVTVMGPVFAGEISWEIYRHGIGGLSCAMDARVDGWMGRV